MIISNSCILPEGWTVETFMQTHNSEPYNPDIAGVFYRAGYIERWGRGIEKICDACKDLGAEMPVYELIGKTLRVHFNCGIVIFKGKVIFSKQFKASCSKNIICFFSFNINSICKIIYSFRVSCCFIFKICFCAVIQ